MSDAARRTMAFWALGQGIAQAAAWVALGALLIVKVPSYQKIFVDFGCQLPGMTLFVFSLSAVLSQHWRLLLRLIVMWPLVSLGVVWLLSPRPEVVLPRRLWYAATWLAFVLFLAFAVLAIVGPLVSLITALSD